MSIEADTLRMSEIIQSHIDIGSAARFQGNEHIFKLGLKFDLEKCVNHHCTHPPADGSVYFSDTRGYHSAFNGGETPGVHLVVALACPEYKPQENAVKPGRSQPWSAHT